MRRPDASSPSLEKGTEEAGLKRTPAWALHSIYPIWKSASNGNGPVVTVLMPSPSGPVDAHLVGIILLLPQAIRPGRTRVFMSWMAPAFSSSISSYGVIERHYSKNCVWGFCFDLVLLLLYLKI